MIGTQLDLFGAPPKPPAIIRVEQPEVSPVEDRQNQNKPDQPLSEEVPQASLETAPLQETPIADSHKGVHVQLPTSRSSEFIVVSIGQQETPPDAEKDTPFAHELPNTPQADKADTPDNETNEKEHTLSVPAGETTFENQEQDYTKDSALNTIEPEVPGIAIAVPQLNEVLPEIISDTEVEKNQPASEALPLGEAPTEVFIQNDSAGEATPIPVQEEITLQAHEQALPEEPQHKAEPEETAPLGVPDDEQLFKRQYYTMRETSGMLGVNQSLLRYWETEFQVLKPRKNRKGDRYFRPADIKNLQLIFHLLKVRKFTIEGAREYLKNHSKAVDTFDIVQRLERIRNFLLELKEH